eukprot:661940-Lingulodinium_polyedra.AAC.1
MDEWERICSHLYSLGIVAPIADVDVFAVNGAPVVNGAFAVEKKGTPLPGQARVTRLIVNMVPSNTYQRIAQTDLGTLASATSWVSIGLGEGFALVWSTDDQKGAFH